MAQRDEPAAADNAAMQRETESTPQPNQQTQPAPDTPAQERRGAFAGAAPKTGSGSVTLVINSDGKQVLRLEDDFKVQDGPDLYVAFGNNGTVDQATLFSKLNATEGKQEYEVPATIDPAKYGQVIIYCKEFAVNFSVASLSVAE